MKAPGDVLTLLSGVGLAGTYILSRWIYRAIVTHHAAADERLADRLADHCEEAATGS